MPGRGAVPRRAVPQLLAVLSLSAAAAAQPSEPTAQPSEPTAPTAQPSEAAAQASEGDFAETPERLPTQLVRSTRGFEAGLRASYSVPFGSSSEGTGIRDLVVGIIPVQLDLGYRWNEHLWFGGFGAAGIGVKGQACRDDGQAPTAPTDGTEQVPTFGVKCDAPNKFRVGAEVIVHLLPSTEDVAPWVGLGVGYEWLNISETLGRRTFVQTFSGLEFVNVQAGVDLAAGTRLRLGPFVQWSLGRYSTIAADASSNADPLPPPGQSVHHWVGAGVKVSVGPYGS